MVRNTRLVGEREGKQASKQRSNNVDKNLTAVASKQAKKQASRGEKICTYSTAHLQIEVVLCGLIFCSSSRIHLYRFHCSSLDRGGRTDLGALLLLLAEQSSGKQVCLASAARPASPAGSVTECFDGQS
jgi:hypothetical protein